MHDYIGCACMHACIRACTLTATTRLDDDDDSGLAISIYDMQLITN
jgi:hypothetical protein